MDLTPAPDSTSHRPDHSIGRDSSGIALFMVIAAVSVLAILVTEFAYISQVTQMVAYGALDQAQAHYLAKSGLKLSLLRLKAYQQVKNFIGKAAGAGGAPPIPKGLIEKIWSFPFFYPIPTNLPGMNTTDKEMIEKFQKESGLEGKFSTQIESESSKYSLNLLLPGYAPSPTPQASPSVAPSAAPSSTPAFPSSSPTFNPESARNSLASFLNSILTQKLEDDPDFASFYRDLRMEELVDNIAAWADRTYEKRGSSSQDKIPMKRGPFYSVSELHMLPMMDDDLYNLFSPHLTASSTAGININTLQEGALRGLIPSMTKEEVAEFFKFRDDDTADNQFKTPDDFFTYLTKNVTAFKNSQQALTDLKTDLTNKNIVLVTDETQFKITVNAQVGVASRIIEAWVTLGQASPANTPQSSPSGTPGQPTPPGAPPPLSGPGPTQNQTQKSGIKITYMKIL